MKDAAHLHEYDCDLRLSAAAERLVAQAKDLYLHDGQNEPSRFGGKIVGYHVHEFGPERGRIVSGFRRRRNTGMWRRGLEGWGNEKRIVW